MADRKQLLRDFEEKYEQRLTGYIIERIECRLCGMADDGPCEEADEHVWLYTITQRDSSPPRDDERDGSNSVVSGSDRQAAT